MTRPHFAEIVCRPVPAQSLASVVLASEVLVGAAGFELATPCSQSRCSTRLSYAPIGRRMDVCRFAPPWSSGPFDAPVKFVLEFNPPGAFELQMRR